jgi:hypothetical protein
LCNYFYEDGTRISARYKCFAEEIGRKTTDSAEKIKKHLKKSHFIYDATEEQFLNKSLHKLDSFLSFSTAVSILEVSILNIFSSMNEVNERRFPTLRPFDYLMGMQRI